MFVHFLKNVCYHCVCWAYSAVSFLSPSLSFYAESAVVKVLAALGFPWAPTDAVDPAVAGVPAIAGSRAVVVNPCWSWIPASRCWRHPCCCWMYCCWRFHSCLSHWCCWPPQPPGCCRSLSSFIAGVVQCLRRSQKNKISKIIQHCQPRLK